MRKLLTLLIALMVSSPAFALGKLDGWAERGGAAVATSGVNSTTRVQQSAPYATVTVYNNGTLTLATIYADSSGTPRANPFSSSSTGYWYFYANDACYDIKITGSFGSYTLTDKCVGGGGNATFLGLINVVAPPYNAIADDNPANITHNNASIVAACIAAGENGGVLIPPHVRYNFNTVMDDPTIPNGTLIYDYARNNGGYGDDGMTGIYEQGDDTVGVTDNKFVVSSGHNASILLDNTGKSPSVCGQGRCAGFYWTGGRTQKGGAAGVVRNIAGWEYAVDPNDADRWIYNFWKFAPWKAVQANYFYWGPSTTVNPGDYVFMNIDTVSPGCTVAPYCTVQKYYKAVQAGVGVTSTNSPPSGTGTGIVDGTVTWDYVPFGYSSTVYRMTDFGRIGINSAPSSSIFQRLKQSPDDTGTYSIQYEPYGISKNVTLTFIPTDGAGTGSTKSIVASASAGFATSSPFSIKQLIFPHSQNVDGDTTPSVSGTTVLSITNSAPTTITDFDNDALQQLLIVVFLDSQTTLANGTEFNLQGGVNVTPPQYSVMGFYKSTTTNAWVEIFRDFKIPARGGNIASGATIAPVSKIQHVTGVAAIGTITVPSWMESGGSLTIIPDGVFTWTNAGNIAVAGTAVVSRAIVFTWDATTGKWYPSYV